MTDIKTKLNELKNIREAATQGEWVAIEKIVLVTKMKAVKAKGDFDNIIGHVQVSNCPNHAQYAEFNSAAANDWETILQALARSGKLQNTPFKDVIELQLQTLAEIREKMGLSGGT